MMIRKGLLTKRQAREKESQENLRYAQDQLNATKRSQQAIYDAEAELLKKRLDNGEISAEEYERQIKLLMGRVALTIAQANDSVQGAERASRRTTWLGDLLGMDDDQVEQLKQQAFQVASEIANTITQIGMQNSQHQLKVETERIDKTKDKELKALDERKRKGVLTEKQYEKQKEAIEKKAEKQKERAEPGGIRAREAVEDSPSVDRCCYGYCQNLVGMGYISFQTAVGYCTNRFFNCHRRCANSSDRISQI